MKHYSITVTELYDDELKQLTIYGIEYSNGERKLVITDITEDYKRLKRLVDLCNELELEVSQLNDVVEDFSFSIKIVGNIFIVWLYFIVELWYNKEL